MKKLLTLLFISLCFWGYAQRDFIIADPANTSNQFTDGETLQYTYTFEEIDAMWGEAKIVFNIIDTSQTPLRIQTLRTDVDIVEGVNPYVCFGSCFDSTVMAIDWNIPAGGGDNYEFHFDPNGKPGKNIFKFEFWTKENQSDLFTLNVEVTIESVGVKERNAGVTLSAYPNPASTHANITVSYAVDNNDNRLVVRNMLGATLMSMPLNPYENTISINAANLTAGIYFYAIENKNQIVAAKKLIIKN